MVDGLGLNSPGVRPVGHRTSPRSSAWARLAKAFWTEVVEFSDGMGKKARLKLITELALGKLTGSPFVEVIEKVKGRLDALVRELGHDPGRREGDVHSEIAFRRVQAWGAVVEDADYKFVSDLASTGVPVGVRSEIPGLRLSTTRRPTRRKGALSDGRRMDTMR